MDYLGEEDSTTYECTECGNRLEEQILMGTVICPECGGTMVPV